MMFLVTLSLKDDNLYSQDTNNNGDPNNVCIEGFIVSRLCFTHISQEKPPNTP